MSVVAYLPQKESGLKRQPAQFIRGGIPVKSGYFMRVFDTDGKFIVAGQMIKWSKSPAMMTIERRVSNPHSNSYRLFGVEESKTYYDIPLSIVGGVELEPGITLNKTDICYFHETTVYIEHITDGIDTHVLLNYPGKGISSLDNLFTSLRKKSPTSKREGDSTSESGR